MRNYEFISPGDNPEEPEESETRRRRQHDGGLELRFAAAEPSMGYRETPDTDNQANVYDGLPLLPIVGEYNAEEWADRLPRESSFEHAVAKGPSSGAPAKQLAGAVRLELSPMVYASALRPGKPHSPYIGSTVVELGDGTKHTFYENPHVEEVTNSNIFEYRGALYPEGPGVEDRLCAIGKVVLDLGCGEAKALRELARIYPDTMFLGVDPGYDRLQRAPFDVRKAGVQLGKDWWTALSLVPEASVDSIISVEGIGRSIHGLYAGSFNAGRAVEAISRVARPGAELRFNAPQQTGYLDYLEQTLGADGWNVDHLVSALNQDQVTVVAQYAA
ncbi:MAG TPA: class I SAM-dependent methyltransferase [Candidatus Saccharimonadales bacterium]|nr:class I SAM-dependent methyltransferase [Candidatus Saccharimonadales bacterium]